MDKIIFGDNQFFGINHMSEEKAQAQAERFRNVASILDVVDTAWDCGIRAFMFNTHAEVAVLCDHFRAHPERYRGLRLYPSLPYAHKYANAVNEKGIMGALNDFVFADSSAGEILSTFARGSLSVVSRDVLEIMKLLVDTELRMFRGLDMPAVFLQNIITDLVVGLGMHSVIGEFARHIRRRYQAEPAFNTMNMPACVNFLLAAGVENPIVCASVNKAGYLMSPDRESYEAVMRSGPFRPFAMSVLASGAIAPREAVDYAVGLGAEAVVFGASSRRHIEETFALLSQAFEATEETRPRRVAT
jgi:hypothetical protein